MIYALLLLEIIRTTTINYRQCHIITLYIMYHRSNKSIIAYSQHDMTFAVVVLLINLKQKIKKRKIPF